MSLLRDKPIVLAIVSATAVVLAAVLPVILERKENRPPVLAVLEANKTSPQFVFTSVEFVVTARDPEGDNLYYRYIVRGPSGVETTNWSSQKQWTWHPDLPGDYQIQAEVRDAHHADINGYDDSRAMTYHILPWSAAATLGAETPDGMAYEWIQLGIALENIGKHREAIEVYDEAIKIDPKNEDAWRKKGENLFLLGDFNAAIVASDKLLEINPHSATALNNKASSLYRLGRSNEALEIIDKAINLDPKDAGLWCNKCGFLRTEEIALYKEALEACNRALNLDPSNASAWNHKGGALYSLGRYHEALSAYDKAVELDPTFSLAWYNRGTAYYQLGKYKDAISCFDKALQIEPNYVAAQNVKHLAEDALKRNH